jgi:DNA polymerase III epsilon subunit family exonuclease
MSTSHERIYVAFDFETTGLSAIDDRVVEVGAVKFDENGHEIDTFESLVNPLRPSNPRARAVHGISDEELRLAPLASEVIPMFLKFLGDPDQVTMIAHNAGFDAGFLGAESARLGLEIPRHGVIDTLAFARRRLPGLPSHRLEVLARHFQLDHRGAHRALADSRRVQRLWFALGGQAGLSEVAAAVYTVHDPSRPLPAPRGWESLAKAAEYGWRVRIIYSGGRRGEQPREITPKRFVNRGGVVYVSSFCHIDTKEKDFRLDRVVRYDVLEPGASV